MASPNMAGRGVALNKRFLCSVPSVMGSALEVNDLSKISSLVMPSVRSGPRCGAQSAKSLAPIEMSAPSISFPRASKASPPPGPQFTSVVVEQGSSAAGQAVARTPVSGLIIPVGYAVCGFAVCLCNLVHPSGLQALCHMLMPLWTVTLLVHTCAHAGIVFWWGVMCMALTPFVVAVGDSLFAGFYIVAFTGFSGWMFWRSTHGPVFLTICAWLAVGVMSCSVAVSSGNPRVNLSVAGFSGLAVAVLNTLRHSRLTLRVS